MITDEQKAKLTPEQLVIAERWEDEKSRLNDLVEKLQYAYRIGWDEEVKRLYDAIERLPPNECEHGHPVFGDCVGCDDIEKILYPELFDENGDRIDGESADPFMINYKTKEQL